MEVRIKIIARDIDRIIYIGTKPWKQATPEERAEYEHLVNFYGTKVLLMVVQNQNIERGDPSGTPQEGKG